MALLHQSPPRWFAGESERAADGACQPANQPGGSVLARGHSPREQLLNPLSIISHFHGAGENRRGKKSYNINESPWARPCFISSVGLSPMAAAAFIHHCAQIKCYRRWRSGHRFFRQSPQGKPLTFNWRYRKRVQRWI